MSKLHTFYWKRRSRYKSRRVVKGPPPEIATFSKIGHEEQTYIAARFGERSFDWTFRITRDGKVDRRQTKDLRDLPTSK